ncbi:maltose acetyltransferase domain-containing protein [Streptomyces profundus]|uniref:maltose acetyltransferase domain-containing protein n=1 Tax=Streptomyces profundus TaxID=2867410 RepID=UPI001D167AAF|nr:maltose acetyltransferase domain-containing protein [Streptomyces sp. MA3_2.13]UED87324.1 sugar O-acetyltransferase [Streptomyces sp. MA3_2.13]
MRAGRLYIDVGEGLDEERGRCQELLYDFNHTRPSATEERARLLGELLGAFGEGGWIEPPLRMAYGSRVHIGKNFYANFNLTLVDDVEVYIGDRVMIGPNVTVTTTGHPVDPGLRVGGTQFSFPVRIGHDVWIGSNVVLLPGVTIGDGSVIGAGSVVTRDVPERVVAVGNPCRVLRPITERDQHYYHRDRPVDWRPEG